MARSCIAETGRKTVPNLGINSACGVDIVYFIRGKEDLNMKTKLLMAVSAIATMFAAFAASSACLWWIYQPEEPTTLQDK